MNKALRAAAQCTLLTFLCYLLTGVVPAYARPAPAGTVEVPSMLLVQAAEGLLQVSCNVPDATLWVDGVEQGSAWPMALVVPAGSHEIRVERVGFAPFLTRVNVEDGRTSNLQVALEPTSGTLVVESNVPEAVVWLDGEEVGSGPLTVVEPLDPGAYVIEVLAEGYAEWRGRVSVFVGQVTRVQAELRSNRGTLVIDSDPPGAAIMLDGEPAGETPTVLDDVDAGRHAVRLSAPGYADSIQAVEVDAEGRAHLRTTLVEAGGDLVLDINVDDARVWLNGYEISRTFDSLSNLAPGVYTIRVSAEGYADYIGQVSINANESIRHRVRLQRLRLNDDGTFSARGDRPNVAQSPAFWTVIGIVVAGGVTAAAVAASQNANTWEPPPTNTAVTLP